MYVEMRWNFTEQAANNDFFFLDHTLWDQFPTWSYNNVRPSDDNDVTNGDTHTSVLGDYPQYRGRVHSVIIPPIVTDKIFCLSHVYCTSPFMFFFFSLCLIGTTLAGLHYKLTIHSITFFSFSLYLFFIILFYSYSYSSSCSYLLFFFLLHVYLIFLLPTFKFSQSTIAWPYEYKENKREKKRENICCISLLK